MIGLATSRRRMTSASAAAVPGGNSMRRPVAAAAHGQAELGAGVDDGVGGAVGHARVERDLDVRTGARRAGGVPRAGLQQRVGEERAEAVELGVVEVALDEHQVSDGDVAVERQPERGCAGADGAGAGVGVPGSNRESTDRSMGRRHWATLRARGARPGP